MRSIILGVCTLAMSVWAQGADAAPGDQYFLQVPNISGNVTHQGYGGWIALNAFSAGLTDPLDTNTGTASGRVSCQELVAIKPLDSTSPLLAADVATARVLGTVQLAVLGVDNHEFLRLTLKNAILTSLLLGGDNARSARTESLSIVAQQIELTTTDPLTGHHIESIIDCNNLR
jgi:type VI secretion system Hcp family effector